MDPQLRGKRVLITGGGTGIGLGIALGLASEGVDVAIASRSPHPEAIERIEQRGVRACWIQTDLSLEDEVVRMVAEATKALGGLDLFVNNAAVGLHEPITRLTAASWHQTIATNVGACAFACREVARLFIAQGHGSILIVGSTAAYNPTYRETSYRAAKAGLKAIMEVLAIELVPYGIRVNMLTPGGFPTGLVAGLPASQTSGVEVPMRRLGRVEELVGAAALLLSDALGSYMTGADVAVDGGFHLRPMRIWSDDEIRELNSCT